MRPAAHTGTILERIAAMRVEARDLLGTLEELEAPEQSEGDGGDSAEDLDMARWGLEAFLALPDVPMALAASPVTYRPCPERPALDRVRDDAAELRVIAELVDSAGADPGEFGDGLDEVLGWLDEL